MIRRLATILFCASLPVAAVAQSKTLRVISNERAPVPFAWVTIEGGSGRITDEQGQLALGQSSKKTLTVSIRRIGFKPWFGKLDLPDTAAVLTVTLETLSEKLSTVTVTGEAPIKSALQLTGYYDRALMREKGLLSAVFIGPEELEFRHPSAVQDMLRGLNGITIRSKDVAFSGNGTCPMAIVLDGIRQCPSNGCHTTGGNGPSIGGRGQGPDLVHLSEIEATAVAAIEVYNRGGNMPVSLQVSDPACGVIAIWTGSRR